MRVRGSVVRFVRPIAWNHRNAFPEVDHIPSPMASHLRESARLATNLIAALKSRTCAPTPELRPSPLPASASCCACADVSGECDPKSCAITSASFAPMNRTSHSRPDTLGGSRGCCGSRLLGSNASRQQSSLGSICWTEWFDLSLSL